MNGIFQALYFTGLIISLAVGVWHFFIPSLFKWHKYIPDVPKWLWVAINWCNIFFSICLTGMSALLLIFHQEVSGRNTAALGLYGLLVLVWLCRSVVTAFYNWGHDVVWKFQLTVPVMLFLILVIPLAGLIVTL